MSDAKIVELTAVKESTDKQLDLLHKEKLSAAQQQYRIWNMTIQERDADLQYVRQQLSNQTGRNKDTTERYSKGTREIKTRTIFV
ncbi:unnamed protein product [Rhizophagus irregularis]|nr:unnamed protein product [Rhizophagus irregularis]